jgi:hypothetical protein
MERSKKLGQRLITLILFTWLVAFLIASLEVGEGCLTIFLSNVPMYFCTMLGYIPLVGPILTYLSGKTLLDTIQLWTLYHAPVATGFILWTSVLISAFYCVISSMMITAIILARRLKGKVN